MGLPSDCELKLYSKHKSGERNLITDVPGVLVGHTTIHKDDINTGRTAATCSGKK